MGLRKKTNFKYAHAKLMCNTIHMNIYACMHPTHSRNDNVEWWYVSKTLIQKAITHAHAKLNIHALIMLITIIVHNINTALIMLMTIIVHNINTACIENTETSQSSKTLFNCSNYKITITNMSIRYWKTHVANILSWEKLERHGTQQQLYQLTKSS